MNGRLVLLFAVALVALGAPTSGFACSCGGPTKSNAKWFFDRADAVFVGRVVRQEVIREWSDSCEPDQRWSMYADETERQNFDHLDRLVVTFEVDTAWKGVTRNEVTVIDSGGSCRYGFSMGHQYLVYARLFSGELRTGYCSGNGRTKPQDHHEQHAPKHIESMGIPVFDPLNDLERNALVFKDECVD